MITLRQVCGALSLCCIMFAAYTIDVTVAIAIVGLLLMWLAHDLRRIEDSANDRKPTDPPS